MFRDRAVKKLKKWFGARSSGFPQEELMRIWKGLFYCYWMSDKPLVQEELAENISSMVASFQTSQDGLGFVQAFAKTFQREWFGVDRWRMDKTMMFVRRFLRHSLKLVANTEWEEVLLEALAGPVPFVVQTLVLALVQDLNWRSWLGEWPLQCKL